MKRKVITYFLLSVLALQLLPVREVGGLLYNNQLTEEICDSFDAGEEKNDIKEGKKSIEDIYHGLYFIVEINSFDILYYFASDTIVKSRFAEDEPTPPPLSA